MYLACLKYTTFVLSDLAYLAYENSLRTPYLEQLNINSSNTINILRTETDRSMQVIYGSLNVFTGIIISSSIIIVLFFITKTATLIAALSFAIAYILMASFSRKRLQRNSKNVLLKSEKVTKSVAEGIGSIRDVILGNNFYLFLNKFQKLDISMRLSISNSMFFTVFPRYALECIGILTISLIACYLVIFGNQKENIFGILGVIALGSQRLLPSFQMIYSGWSLAKTYTSSFNSLISLLEKKDLLSITYEKNNKKLNFQKKIELINLSFSYPSDNKKIIKNLNLSLKYGDRIGILGETGSGKSTLLDIITGLIKPNSGCFYVDNINLLNLDSHLNINHFQDLISYVPQNSYLIDGSFKSNIAFGIKEDDIDIERVKNSAKLAKISSFIEKTKYGYETFVGERGVLLAVVKDKE